MRISLVMVPHSEQAAEPTTNSVGILPSTTQVVFQVVSSVCSQVQVLGRNMPSRPRPYKCKYAPLCSARFDSGFNRDRHCKNVHGGPERLFCNKCDTLKFFSSAQSLQKHISEHSVDDACSYCAATYSSSYMKKHMRKCPSRLPTPQVEDDADFDMESNEGEVINIAKPRGPPLYRPQKTGVKRSSRAAPTSLETDERLAQFVKWVTSKTAIGKSTQITSYGQFFNKFRTALGKLSKFHGKSSAKLFFHLNRQASCLAMFKPKPLNDFTMWLGKGDNGKELSLRTVYNYLRTLVIFFEWKVNALGQDQFKAPLESLQGLCLNLSRQKDKVSQDIVKKAARLSALPTVPQFLTFMSEKLKPKVDRVRQVNKFQWKQYVDCRNYILMALLFGVPPQRKQFLESMMVENITYKDGYTILQVHEHKTQRRYGPVVVALPPYYYDDFQLYLEVRSDFATLQNLDKSLFIKHDGKPDPYLTRHFEAMTHEEFGQDVTIRDCRSIFVNFANDKLDLKQLYELSRQMCHSFQMQQSEYRADDSVQRAITTMTSMHKMTELLPLCSADQEIHCEEVRAEVEEEKGDDDQGVEIPGDNQDDEEASIEFDGELTDEQLVKFVAAYNASHKTAI